MPDLMLARCEGCQSTLRKGWGNLARCTNSECDGMFTAHYLRADGPIMVDPVSDLIYRVDLSNLTVEVEPPAVVVEPTPEQVLERAKAHWAACLAECDEMMRAHQSLERVRDVAIKAVVDFQREVDASRALAVVAYDLHAVAERDLKLSRRP